MSTDMGEAFGGDQNVPEDPFADDVEITVEGQDGTIDVVHVAPGAYEYAAQLARAYGRQDFEHLPSAPRKINWKAVVALDVANSALIPMLNSAWRLKDDTARDIIKQARRGNAPDQPWTDEDEKLEDIGREVRHLAQDIEREVVRILRDLTVMAEAR